ncbi:hypothetical protein JNB63_07450 [Microbacterium trichothecenolyticum]|uniref:hypothetical protein n=1 Tax=Microbacterium trichothecenolyticum TaxID=69370 RepID=UPI001C6F0777|nr:hypothetical protein [Microbacterium trichothecenolyticum]MBW9119921.1 hypothetical protein [Microbacterium trichothecenolyticum]
MNDIDDNEENDTSGPGDARPLGYWLRAVDGLLTREFAKALEAEGITRRDWMLLNVLSGDIDAPEFRERLARKGKRLRGLEERGWAEEQGDGTWTLTDLGRAEKQRIGTIVDGLRARVVAAVGGDEAYAALTGSLEAIARELGWDEDATGPERGFGGFGGFGPGFGPGFRPGFGPRFGPGFGGFGPGFGGRPRPFDPDIHDGYGRNRHRGFAPGRPGHPAERFDEPLRGHADEGCHGHHTHHDRETHGHGGHGHGGHGHGSHRGHGYHGERGDHGRGGRRSQHAYERGFDAGFARGRESGAA